MKGPFWKKYGKDKVCGITHCRLRPGKDSNGQPHVIFLKCGHGFYRKPLELWFNKSKLCPMCRKEVT